MPWLLLHAWNRFSLVVGKRMNKRTGKREKYTPHRAHCERPTFFSFIFFSAKYGICANEMVYIIEIFAKFMLNMQCIFKSRCTFKHRKHKCHVLYIVCAFPCGFKVKTIWHFFRRSVLLSNFFSSVGTHTYCALNQQIFHIPVPSPLFCGGFFHIQPFFWTWLRFLFAKLCCIAHWIHQKWTRIHTCFGKLVAIWFSNEWKHVSFNICGKVDIKLELWTWKINSP